jgi:diguanylate cyclase (GGDEF)-like protein
VGARPDAVDPAAFPDDVDPDRTALRRRQIAGVQAFIAGSYVMDTAFMALLVLCGSIGLEVPLVYALCFAIGCGAFTLAVTGDRGERYSDPFLTVPQTAFASTLQLGMMAWAPQIGVPLLTALFIVVGFAGLRLRLPQAGMVSLWLGAGLLAVIGLRGAEFSIPLGSSPERLASGLWLCSVLGRVILLGQYGARLRHALHRRNEALNRTMAIAERLASSDDLTGALNRASILKAIEGERGRMARGGKGFSVALLDLDHFKRINDGFGHLVGDRVLVQLVRKIVPMLRASDAIGRYGGEEFVLLLADAADEAGAGTALERIADTIRNHSWPDIAPGLAVTLSAGFAACRPDESLHQLLSRADAALYRAKNAGRDRVCEG